MTGFAALCKGSFALNSGCRKCLRCESEFRHHLAHTYQFIAVKLTKKRSDLLYATAAEVTGPHEPPTPTAALRALVEDHRTALAAMQALARKEGREAAFDFVGRSVLNVDTPEGTLQVFGPKAAIDHLAMLVRVTNANDAATETPWHWRMYAAQVEMLAIELYGGGPAWDRASGTVRESWRRAARDRMVMMGRGV